MTDLSGLNDQEKQLVDWLADMNEDEALPLANRMLLEEGASPIRVLELCRMAMDIVGQRFEEGEYFLPELVLAGEMLDMIGEVAKPLIKQGEGGESKKLGKVLIGTVHGDLHDIGKNIVAIMLKGAGYEVIDLGVDVPADRIVAAVKEQDAPFLGLSALLTTTMRNMKEIIDRLQGEGITTKVCIGGAPTSEAFAREIGADAYCSDAFAVIDYLKSAA